MLCVNVVAKSKQWRDKISGIAKSNGGGIGRRNDSEEMAKISMA